MPLKRAHFRWLSRSFLLRRMDALSHINIDKVAPIPLNFAAVQHSAAA